MTLFSNKQGFTVIEIMVAVAIISVLIAVVVSNFSSSRLQFSLPEVAYRFGQDVRRAQGLALAAAEYKDASGVSLPVDGYGVYVDLTSLGDKKIYFVRR
jgi:prepilin-type N-terminal cleavage/methylation domain-containing protein